tara:strand:+ start:800 stop:1162 length:363 start_codon:yes stop_codon:yes gene_type:complete
VLGALGLHNNFKIDFYFFIYYNNNKMPYKDKDFHKIRNQLYYHSLKGKKAHRLKCWKRNGIIDTDWDLLYDFYMKETNCWICDKFYNNSIKTDRKCLDHDKKTGEIRFIICSHCNLNIVR